MGETSSENKEELDIRWAPQVKEGCLHSENMAMGADRELSAPHGVMVERSTMQKVDDGQSRQNRACRDIDLWRVSGGSGAASVYLITVSPAILFP